MTTLSLSGKRVSQRKTQNLEVGSDRVFSTRKILNFLQYATRNVFEDYINILSTKKLKYTLFEEHRVKRQDFSVGEFSLGCHVPSLLPC